MQINIKNVIITTTQASLGILVELALTFVHFLLCFFLAFAMWGFFK